MQNGKRMHPMAMIAAYIKTVKEVFFLFILLFIVNIASEAWWVEIGRVLFIAYLVYRLFAVVLEWMRTRYVLGEEAVELDQGVFTRKHRSIPYQRVQNVQSKTPFYLQPFGLTSLTLETGAEGDESSLTFAALKVEEAKRIEETLDAYRNRTTQMETVEYEVDEQAEVSQDVPIHHEKTIHFKPTRKDILKASVLSFSYVLLIPVLLSIFQNIDEVYDVSTMAEDAYDFLVSSWYLILGVVVVFILIAVSFGLIRTYLKYGKYEISSDDERIYIRSGVLNEQYFSIRKQNVQAVKIEQSLLKRMLKLAEVKLVSAGSLDFSGEEINSLYPFLPADRAYTLIEELLPGFEVKTDMERLPRKSLVARFIRIPWVWLIGTGLLIFFKPELWFLSLVLLALTIFYRIMDYNVTRFLTHGKFIQFRSGGFSATTFITTRNKVIEFELKQSRLKKRFGLATIETTNRAKPVHVQTLADITSDMAEEAFVWYSEREGQ
ncbi:PH domain-containing protein [Virgibacillus sp. FSP13]